MLNVKPTKPQYPRRTQTSTVDGLTRRNFVKGSMMGLSLSALNATGVGLLINQLVSENAQAGEDWKGFAMRFMDKLPNGFKKDLCQEELLGLAYLYMMNGGRDYGLMRTLLVNQRARSVYSEHVDKSTWFCDTGAHMVACATYMWKYPRESIAFDNETYKYMENNFYHNLALRLGINDFYDQHVSNDGSNNETEKWLVESLFACAEEYPQHGKIKAQEYLTSNFNERVELISDLSKKFNAMSYSKSDKLDRDCSGKSGVGPLNNWHRLVSAQWGAFFLSYHYEFIEKTGKPWNRKGSKHQQQNNCENIFWNIEYITKKNIGIYFRGPPNYFS